MQKSNDSRAASAAVPHRWTLQRMQTFMATLERTGNVAAAARSAGMSRRAAYRLRARLPGHPFDLTWTAAMAPREAFRRLTTGYRRGPQPSAPGDGGSH